MPVGKEQWDELEKAAAEIGVTMDDVMDVATGLPIEQQVKTPSCPACRAKFAHDRAGMRCRSCGLPDEVRVQGRRAVLRWQKAQGAVTPRGGSIQRRRRAHGRPRGSKRRVS